MRAYTSIFAFFLLFSSLFALSSRAESLTARIIRTAFPTRPSAGGGACEQLTVRQCIKKLGDGSLSTLNSLLDMPQANSPFLAALSQLLDGQGSIQYPQITAFAPNDKAFEQWHDRVLKDTTADVDQELISAIAAYHVLPSAVTSANIPPGQVRTFTTILNHRNFTDLNNKLRGQAVMMHAGNDNTWTLLSGPRGDARFKANVITRDYKCRNGYLHIVDTVLQPPLAPAQVLEMQGNPGVLRAFAETDLLDVLNAPATTVFIPTDDVLQRIVGILAQRVKAGKDPLAEPLPRRCIRATGDGESNDIALSPVGVTAAGAAGAAGAPTHLNTGCGSTCSNGFITAMPMPTSPHTPSHSSAIETALAARSALPHVPGITDPAYSSQSDPTVRVPSHTPDSDTMPHGHERLSIDMSHLPTVAGITDAGSEANVDARPANADMARLNDISCATCGPSAAAGNTGATSTSTNDVLSNLPVIPGITDESIPNTTGVSMVTPVSVSNARYSDTSANAFTRGIYDDDDDDSEDDEDDDEDLLDSIARALERVSAPGASPSSRPVSPLSLPTSSSTATSPSTTRMELFSTNNAAAPSPTPLRTTLLMTSTRPRTTLIFNSPPASASASSNVAAPPCLPDDAPVLSASSLETLIRSMDLPQLLQLKKAVQTVLSKHIVPGETVYYTQLSRRPLKTLAQTQLTTNTRKHVDKQGRSEDVVFVNGARVIGASLTRNGVMYFVDDIIQ